MELNTLYKKTSTGAIQSWAIKVESDHHFTISGQIEGKKTISTPTYCLGKNMGKKNATSNEEQALKEAHAKWEGKKKKGYVESVERATAGEVNPDFVAGGWPPMLAEKFRDHSHKIKYPCGGQPKLDGHRSTRRQGHFYSKTQKLITSLPHLSDMLREMGLENCPFDGELYNHDYKDDFEKLSSMIRKKDPIPPSAQDIVQYHVYDLVSGLTYPNRYMELQAIFKNVINNSPYSKFFQLVPLDTIHSKEEAMTRELHWRGELGFEGYMLRNMDVPYLHKRNINLQKIKVFQDAEFKVLAVEDGIGKMKGKAAKFICEITDERGTRTFKCTPKGTVEYKQQLFEDHSLWKGKMLTVEFLNYTNKNHVPRHGIGLRFRDMDF